MPYSSDVKSAEHITVKNPLKSFLDIHLLNMTRDILRRTYHKAFKRFTLCKNPRHPWPLSSESSLACHIYCDTGHPFIMVFPRTRDIPFYCRAFSSGVSTTYFYYQGLSRPGFEHPINCLRDERS